jgi:large subunit ribosomal protein L23
MAALEYYDIILKPVVTEKSMSLIGEKKYTFYVNPDADKLQIKNAVEKMFENAKVVSVNTMNCRAKKKRGTTIGYTAKRKKAIVTLSADSKDIELFAGL